MINLNGMTFKYLQLKLSDCEKYLSPNQKAQLTSIVDDIQYGRKQDGKKDNVYLVINTDEPYADEIIEIMKRHGHWG